MKKLIIFCAVILSAIVFSSCKNDELKGPFCWEVRNVILPAWGETPTQETIQYFWGTSKQVDEETRSINEQLAASGLETYYIQKSPVLKAKADCQ